MRPSFICAFMTAPLFLQNDSETTRVFVSLINSARVSSCRTLSLSAQKLIYRQLVQLIWLLKFACRALASKSWPTCESCIFTLLHSLHPIVPSGHGLGLPTRDETLFRLLGS